MAPGIISRIRRNHGLEHATIHVLSEKHKGFSAQGNSGPSGFHLNIYGDLSESDIHEAVDEAYRRLQGGEHELAVHPNCGTVLVTTAAIAALAAQTVFAVEQWREPRGQSRAMTFANALPAAVVAVVGALIVGRPLGVELQARYTVDGHLRGLQVAEVRRVSPSPVTRVFQLLLTGGSRAATSYVIRTRDM